MISLHPADAGDEDEAFALVCPDKYSKNVFTNSDVSVEILIDYYVDAVYVCIIVFCVAVVGIYFVINFVKIGFIISELHVSQCFSMIFSCVKMTVYQGAA